MTLMSHPVPFRQQTFIGIQNMKRHLKALCDQRFCQVSRDFGLYYMFSYFSVQIGTRPFDFNIDDTIQYLIDALYDDG